MKSNVESLTDSVPISVKIKSFIKSAVFILSVSLFSLFVFSYFMDRENSSIWLYIVSLLAIGGLGGYLGSLFDEMYIIKSSLFTLDNIARVKVNTFTVKSDVIDSLDIPSIVYDNSELEFVDSNLSLKNIIDTVNRFTDILHIQVRGGYNIVAIPFSEESIKEVSHLIDDSSFLGSFFLENMIEIDNGFFVVNIFDLILDIIYNIEVEGYVFVYGLLDGSEESSDYKLFLCKKKEDDIE